MRIFHGTTEENFEKILREKVIWSVRDAPSRCTYFATSLEEARQYGDFVFEVEYEPKSLTDNYCEGCWQLRIYDPIPIHMWRELHKFSRPSIPVEYITFSVVITKDKIDFKKDL